MQIGARTSGGIIKIVVGTNGEGYTSPPGVTISGGGGAGASAVAAMAGTRVESIIVTNAGTGYTGNPTVSFSGGGGTGAAATAYAHTGPLRPMCFFKGRFGDVYGVDGMGRGIRWTGGTAAAAPIGLQKPPVGPGIVPTSADTISRYVPSIQMVDAGAGYHSTPVVVLTGGTPTVPATARAVVVNGRVSAVRVLTAGAGYQATPIVSFSGGIGQGGTFDVGVRGKVLDLVVTNQGTGYSPASNTPPTITVSASNGLTGFIGSVLVGLDGRVSGIQVINAGTGATTTPTFAINALTGSGAAASPLIAYGVHSLTVGNSGAGYFTPPIVTLRPQPQDVFATLGQAECAVNSQGQITAATVVSQGQYSFPPTAYIEDSSARAQASLTHPLRGKYRCAIRYIDNTDASLNGPLASSISETVEKDTANAASNLVWTLSHPALDDRVHAVELWRTSGDQSVLLFRVATILRTDPQWSTPYTDTLTDLELTNPTRKGYGLMPITLPSGQINARRFAVPPGEFAVAVMFQDRAWYALDTTGRRPNSLMYSEVDEPESVPDANELVVQENTDTPDKIVALVPLSSALLVVQSAHIYKLMYVAQPVIDASIMLAAHRGVLNHRCWAIMAGVAFLVDSVGLYAFDGGQEQSVSLPVDNYWRDQIIDFAQSDKFHLAADHLTRTVRFFYCRSGDTEPVRALCYCTATQAWWEETYPTAVTATAPMYLQGQKREAKAGADGAWRKSAGVLDGSQPVPYSFRTGNMYLQDEPDRAIDLIYSPTTGDSQLSLGLHYNDSPTARPNAVASDRGSGFSVVAGGAAQLNLKRSRSALGDATGLARAYYSGRKDERNAGGDQHVAVALAGVQSGSDRVSITALRVKGAG
jgi:hypothetical protein